MASFESDVIESCIIIGQQAARLRQRVFDDQSYILQRAQIARELDTAKKIADYDDLMSEIILEIERMQLTTEELEGLANTTPLNLKHILDQRMYSADIDTLCKVCQVLGFDIYLKKRGK